MITATKEFKWSMAHMLDGHLELCKNLHGHNYKMEVTVAMDTAQQDKDNRFELAENGPAKGMVMDFKMLKHIVKDILIDKLDHATMINEHSSDDFEIQLAVLLRQYHKKVYIVPYRPTAENMAKNFLMLLQASPLIEAMGVEVVKVKIYETDSSFAEATRRVL